MAYAYNERWSKIFFSLFNSGGECLFFLIRILEGFAVWSKEIIMRRRGDFFIPLQWWVVPPPLPLFLHTYQGVPPLEWWRPTLNGWQWWSHGSLALVSNFLTHVVVTFIFLFLGHFLNYSFLATAWFLSMNYLFELVASNLTTYLLYHSLIFLIWVKIFLFYPFGS